MRAIFFSHQFKDGQDSFENGIVSTHHDGQRPLPCPYITARDRGIE